MVLLLQVILDPLIAVGFRMVSVLLMKVPLAEVIYTTGEDPAKSLNTLGRLSRG